MRVMINGKSEPVDDGLPLDDLLRSRKLDPACVVAELNGAIIGKEAYASTRLSAGDRLELVHFVGGG